MASLGSWIWTLKATVTCSLGSGRVHSLSAPLSLQTQRQRPCDTSSELSDPFYVTQLPFRIVLQRVNVRGPWATLRVHQAKKLFLSRLCIPRTVPGIWQMLSECLVSEQRPSAAFTPFPWVSLQQWPGMRFGCTALAGPAWVTWMNRPYCAYPFICPQTLGLLLHFS